MRYSLERLAQTYTDVGSASDLQVAGTMVLGKKSGGARYAVVSGLIFPGEIVVAAAWQYLIDNQALFSDNVAIVLVAFRPTEDIAIVTKPNRLSVSGATVSKWQDERAAELCKAYAKLNPALSLNVSDGGSETLAIDIGKESWALSAASAAVRLENLVAVQRDATGLEPIDATIFPPTTKSVELLCAPAPATDPAIFAVASELASQGFLRAPYVQKPRTQQVYRVLRSLKTNKDEHYTTEPDLLGIEFPEVKQGQVIARGDKGNVVTAEAAGHLCLLKKKLPANYHDPLGYVAKRELDRIVTMILPEKLGL